MPFQTIKFAHFSWINYDRPSQKELQDLGIKYKFHPLSLTECVNPSQRTKIDVFAKYTFFVLMFPVYNRKTREITQAEVDVFIGRNFLITIQHGELKTFSDFFQLLKSNPNQTGMFSEKSPEKLLYEILNKMYLYCLPMIDHLIIDCDNIEKAIFSGKERQMVPEILIIRRNITDFRKVMAVHRNVVKKAATVFKESPLFVMKKEDIYFESLIDSAEEIWDAMENLKERIEALHQTNESQITFMLSDTMRILTIISVFIFPITLIATIFSMRVDQGMPFAGTRYGFWYVIGFMALIVLAMFTLFKKKKWL